MCWCGLVERDHQQQIAAHVPYGQLDQSGGCKAGLPSWSVALINTNEGLDRWTIRSCKSDHGKPPQPPTAENMYVAPAIFRSPRVALLSLPLTFRPRAPQGSELLRPPRRGQRCQRR